MIKQDFLTATLTGGGSFTFPAGFISLDSLIYSSDDGNIFNPDFLTDGIYTLVQDPATKLYTIAYDSQYIGTVDQYFTYEDGVTRAWTNDKLVAKVAELTTNEKLIKKDSNQKYTGKAAIEVMKIIDYLNTANEKIARKLKTCITEEITLDENKCFDISNLANELISVNVINQTEDPDSDSLYWRWVDSQYIQCPNQNAGDTAYINYQYLPSAITMSNGEVIGNYAFTRGIVSPELPAYFATYEYLKTNDPTNADQWLVLWNVGFNELRTNRGEILTISVVDKPIRSRIRGR